VAVLSCALIPRENAITAGPRMKNRYLRRIGFICQKLEHPVRGKAFPEENFVGKTPRIR
jgi:hypothetical protein